MPGELGPGTVMDSTVHPPVVSALHYEIIDWLGDDLIESFPCYLASPRLARAIEESGLTGCHFASAQVAMSPQAQEPFSKAEVPRFRWLVIAGQIGQDDFAVTGQGQITVSAPALRLLRTFTLDYCGITDAPAA
ncbi:hypothetical protein [Longispora albida]|uniref:hypothetical protein n=1 Tax=Longispora albida TaxID=203523 RepID=UPI000370E87F|nr:hypothetical protein [Longispora albida]